MARTFLVPVDLAKNELRNAAIQNLGTAPSSPVKGQLYMSTADNIMYWYNGSGWVAAQGGAGAVPATTVTTQAVGDAAVVGVATTYAREDHKHGREAFGAITAQASFGLSSSNGVAATLARSDHVHGTPSLGTTPSTLAIGDSAAGGAATDAAKTDHKHAMPGFGVIVAQTTFGGSKTDGVSANLARSDHTHGTPTHVAADHAAIPLSALAAPTVDVAWGGFKITGLGTPTAVGDATTKGYVDNALAGLSWKESCRIGTTANIGTLTGLAAIDGVTPVANDRVLVMAQTTTSQNGIYLAQSGAWTRALDADATGELEGAAVYVTEGTANGDKAFTCTTDGAIIPGTTGNVWAQFGGGSAVIGGTGVTVSGSTVNVNATNGSIVVAADDIGVGYAGTGTTFGSAVTAARSDHNHAGTYIGKFAQDCAAATSTTVTHNLNTQDVTVACYLKSGTFEEVDVDIEHTSVNVATIRFATAPAAGAYRIVVTG